jgi:SAM-dependent methyltransferase
MNTNTGNSIFLTQHARAWQNFYKQKGNTFFKDRHYLLSEFPDLLRGLDKHISLLDVGCGVGNACLPLLESLPYLEVVGFDVSSAAIKCLLDTSKFNTRLHVLPYDILPNQALLSKILAATNDIIITPTSKDFIISNLFSFEYGRIARECLPILSDKLEKHGIQKNISTFGYDFALLIFVLSALAPEFHLFVLKEIALCLKPGVGKLLIRDYAEGDAASKRLLHVPGTEENVHIRGDGTLAIFFSISKIQYLAAEAGLIVDEIKIIRRHIDNRSEGSSFDRAWISAILRKPYISEDIILSSKIKSSNQIVSYIKNPTLSYEFDIIVSTVRSSLT